MKFFRDAERLGGIPAKVRLASLARVTSSEASVLEDDPAVLARLSEAMTRLRSDLLRRPSGTYAPVTVPATDAGLGARLRRQIEVFVDLMSQRAQILGDVTSAARRVTETASNALGVARVSVWTIDLPKTSIQCIDLFDKAAGGHSAGTVLHAHDYAPYFEALATERTIMANDARNDPRTACFAASYLEPLGIGAMLDVPIWARGRMMGVVCHEHTGGPRRWDLDEERFAYLMSNFLALAIEREAETLPPLLR